MFERFTDRARRVVVLAQEEARLLDHNYIGTEHLLLALLRDGEGVAARALGSLGVRTDVVRAQVEEIIGEGGSAPTGHIPFTPRAKRVLELSLREALGLGHSDIGTEHIALGLIREGEGVACQVMERLGVPLARARERVLQTLATAPEAERGSSASHAVVESSQFLSRGAAAVVDRAAARGDRRLGTEHVLLWLLDDPDCGAARALRDEGVDLEALGTRLEGMLDQAGGSTDPDSSEPPAT